MLRATQEQEWWADQVVQVILKGKQALDTAMLDIGRLVAETLMYMEREERSGPDYHPTSSGLHKWASQRGSIYIGDQKLSVEHPRLRGPEGEVGLRTYEQLKNRGGFSEELLAEVLRGMSARKYEETVTNAGKAFGVTPSSVSRHLVEATAKQLKQFQERSLEAFPLFAMLSFIIIDPAGMVPLVALRRTKKPGSARAGTCRDHTINGPRSWTTQSPRDPSNRRAATKTGSGGVAPFVAVVEPTHSRQRDDFCGR